MVQRQSGKGRTRTYGHYEPMSLYLDASRATPRRSRARLDDAKTPAAPKGVALKEAVVDYLNLHRNKGSSPETIREYAYVLDDRTPTKAKWLPLLAWCERRGLETVTQLDKDYSQEWLDDMKEKAAPSSWRRSVVVLKRFLNYCVDEGYIDRPPIRLTEPKRKETEIAVFSDFEMDRIARVVQKENVRDFAIFMLLVDTGIRCKEILGLTLDDVRLDRKEILVVRKGGKKQVVPIKDSVGPVKAWLRERGDTGPDVPWLFLAFGGSPTYAGGNGKKKRTMTDRSLRKYIRPDPLTKIGLYQLCVKWGKLAGVTEARNSPHTYRHYFAITYLRNGGDVFTLKEVLGHTKLEMTMRYARMAQVDVKRVHAIASPASRFLPARSRRIDEG